MNLLLNGKPTTEAEAKAALEKIYGPRRVPEILAGLASGTYGCASVAGGYLEIAKEVPKAPETPKAPPAPK